MALLAASACGGGGGGGGGSPAPPTVAPTNASYRPAAAGDTFTYTGTLTQSFVRVPLTVVPLPSPNPTNAATLQYSVTQQVSVTATAVPNGIPSSALAYDFHSVETDLASLETLTTTADSIVAYVRNGGSTDVEETSSSASSGDYAPDNVQYATTYGSGNGLLDVIPESGTGPIGTSNNAALTQIETDPDGQITRRTVNADGSYTETSTYPDGTNATATENTNGTGSYNFPFLGFEPNGTGTMVTIPAPSGTTLTVGIVYPAGLFHPTQTAIQQPLALWYPNPPTLSHQQYLDNGPAALPSACSAAVPVLGGRATNQLVQTTTSVDTIFGEQETSQRTSYTATGLGVVCSLLTDVVLQYYDYSGQSFSSQTGSSIYFGSSPVQTTTTSETLAMTQATVLGLTSAQRRTQSLSSQGAYLSDATFRALLERARTRRRSSARFKHGGPVGV
jgi:hypothetical protein